jgi:hypothetical protein
MHLFDEEIITSMPISPTSSGMAPKELMASTMSTFPRDFTAVAISGSGLTMPDVVSQCMTTMVAMARSASICAATSSGLGARLSPTSSVAQGRPSRSRILAQRRP